MYKLRPKRDRRGKIKKLDLKSEDLPNTRIEPDPRWFGEQGLSVFLIAHLVDHRWS
jgi:hypothetical protein